MQDASLGPISKEAIIELRSLLEELATNVTNDARMVAIHSGRKGIKKEDINFTKSKFLR